MVDGQDMRNAHSQQVDTAELSKPAVSQGDQVIEALSGMSQRLARLEDTVRKRLGELETSVVDMQDQLNSFDTMVRGRLDDLDDPFDSLEHSLSKLKRQVEYHFSDLNAGLEARGHNELAWTLNSRLLGLTDKLSPLKNALNGDPIARFPRTVGELTLMADKRVESLLNELQLDTSGDASERMARLRIGVGVRPDIPGRRPLTQC